MSLRRTLPVLACLALAALFAASPVVAATATETAAPEGAAGRGGKGKGNAADAAKKPATDPKSGEPKKLPPPMLPSVIFAPLLTDLPKPGEAGSTLMGPTLSGVPTEADELPDADPVYAAFQRGLWVRAFALAIPRAEAGDPAAMTMVATLYETGSGVKISLEKAARWYRLATDKGDREAAAALGQMYVEGRGVPRDLGRAAELFRLAAAKDQPVALFNLAMMRLRGATSAVTGEDPTDLLIRAADQGNVEAQYSLATWLAAPENPRRDPIAAVRWMREAALAGFEAAEVEFALMLANGKGIEKNLPDAFVWFRRSALRGNAIGRNRLARMYAVGLGVEPDPVEAWKWHSLAKRQGLPDLWLETRLAAMSDADRKRAETMADAIAGSSAPPSPRPSAADDVTPPAAHAPARP